MAPRIASPTSSETTILRELKGGVLESVRQLRRLLEDSSPEVRLKAAQALIQSGADCITLQTDEPPERMPKGDASMPSDVIKCGGGGVRFGLTLGLPAPAEAVPQPLPAPYYVYPQGWTPVVPSVAVYDAYYWQWTPAGWRLVIVRGLPAARPHERRK